MPSTVLLVDDSPELRSVLDQALRLKGGLEVVAEAGDGQSAVALAAQHQPDVVVLDLGLSDLTGREVLTRIRRASPSSLVVVYSGSYTPDSAVIATSVDAYVEETPDVAYLVDLVADVAGRVPRRAEIRLGPGARDVGSARRFVMERCRDWECAAIAEDASIVVSELVANALVHVRTPCELAVELRRDVFHIEVVDHGAGMPDLKDATTEDEHGRGLLLVSILCSAWGTEPRERGKRVWAEIPVDRARGPEAGRGTHAWMGGSRQPEWHDDFAGDDHVAIA